MQHFLRFELLQHPMHFLPLRKICFQGHNNCKPYLEFSSFLDRVAIAKRPVYWRPSVEIYMA